MDDLELAVAATMARQHADDARGFLRQLAELLEAALPGEALVKRRGLFGGDKRPIERLEITLGESRFAVDDPGRGPLAFTEAHVVRDIALKTESVDAALWIERIGASIARRAEGSRLARVALSALLEVGL